ncbi:MAG: type II toxin-antitoxin system HicB family antitoxin [Chloroflexota bacterium]
MLTSYILAALKLAKYEILEDGTYYGEIPGFDGVWASASTLEECRESLRETLEDWLILGLRMGHSLPVVANINLIPADAS